MEIMASINHSMSGLGCSNELDVSRCFLMHELALAPVTDFMIRLDALMQAACYAEVRMILYTKFS